MAFEKKKNKHGDEELSGAEEFGSKEVLESAAVINHAAVEAGAVAVPQEDPFKQVRIVPRITSQTGATLSFTIGGQAYTITDGKPCLVPLDVARQLKEKGYIPS